METAQPAAPQVQPAYTPRPAAPLLPANDVDVRLGEPVLVSMAAAREQTWGYWQFPTLSRMPSGDLLLTINNTQDDGLCYGHAAPAWLSHDQGRTWHAADLDDKELTVSHSPIAQVQDGEFLCVPMPVGMRPETLDPQTLGEPAGRFFSYVWHSFYPLERFPREIQHYMRELHGLRWTPATRRWEGEPVRIDMDQALIRINEEGMAGSALTTTSLEYRPVRLGDELFHADYRIPYVHEDGSLPSSWEVICMVSGDNGRTWQRRGLAAHDPHGAVGPNEAALCVTSDGDLVCVARTTDHRQLPMWLTFSKDQGRTWSEPQELFNHGVLPQLERLPNGVMALAYGRPGVHLSFSPDGSGQAWTEPVEVLPTGAPEGSEDWDWEQLYQRAGNDLQKDGYTSIVALADDTFLIAYTDSAHLDARGRSRKALMVRQVAVRPR